MKNVSEIFCKETIFLKYFAMKQYFRNILQCNNISEIFCNETIFLKYFASEHET